MVFFQGRKKQVQKEVTCPKLPISGYKLGVLSATVLPRQCPIYSVWFWIPSNNCQGRNLCRRCSLSSQPLNALACFRLRSASCPAEACMDVSPVSGPKDLLVWLNDIASFLAMPCVIIIAFRLLWWLCSLMTQPFRELWKCQDFAMNSFFLNMSIWNWKFGQLKATLCYVSVSGVY